jgi:hypothetical protein
MACIFFSRHLNWINKVIGFGSDEWGLDSRPGVEFFLCNNVHTAPGVHPVYLMDTEDSFSWVKVAGA